MASVQKAPILILNVTRQPYLSIARFSGGIKAFGYEYIYFHPQDALVRNDFVKKIKLHKTWDAFVEFVKTVNQ